MLTFAMVVIPSFANAQINFDFTNDSRINQISVDGRPLLVRGGAILIGSQSGRDEPENNIESTGNTDGLMRSRSGNTPPLPFKLRFSRLAENKLSFYAEVGPASVEYATLS